MGLDYVEGGSDIAQQLHAVRELSAKRESQSTMLLTPSGDDLCMSVGSRSVKPRREAFKTDETTSYNKPVEPVISNHSQPAARDSGPRCIARPLLSREQRGATDRDGTHFEVGVDKDSCRSRRAGGEWSRLHNRSRRSFFHTDEVCVGAC